MGVMSEFTAWDEPSEADELFPEGDVRGLQVLSAALLAGAVIFGLVVVGMHLGGVFPAPAGGPGAAERSLIWLLSLVHAGVFVLSWIVSSVLPTVMLHGVLRQAPSSPEAGVRRLIGSLRGAHMVRCAFREGPALFGLVICLVASIHGVLAELPRYWLNAASAVVFVLWGLAAFPTRDRLIGRLLGVLVSAVAKA